MIGLAHSSLIRNNYASNLINTFEQRVEADGGVFESGYLLPTISRLRAVGFYQKASLLLTGNGYKESKLYSFLPTGGTGDFTFTRAITATRKGNSLIEAVPYNLFNRSQEIENAVWLT